MKKTKIDWCDSTVNPVVGCPRGCEYCYGPRVNGRFKQVDDFSKPQYFLGRLNQLRGTKPRSIFMNSMSDYEFWPYPIVEKVGQAMEDNPQHNYLFLTKGRQAFEIQRPLIKKALNVFNGRTIACQKDAELWENARAFDFLSIEPLLGPIVFFPPKLDNIGQVIIGAETGTRPDKVVPKKEWVDEIVEQCDKRGIPVFMKSNIRNIMGADFRQDELLWSRGKKQTKGEE